MGVKKCLILIISPSPQSPPIKGGEVQNQPGLFLKLMAVGVRGRGKFNIVELLRHKKIFGKSLELFLNNFQLGPPLLKGGN